MVRPIPVNHNEMSLPDALSGRLHFLIGLYALSAKYIVGGERHRKAVYAGWLAVYSVGRRADYNI